MPPKKNEAYNTTSMGSMIKAGFGLSIGSWLWTIVALIIAMAFFIPGLMMVIKERKKKKEGEEENKGKLIIGYVLMGLGMLLGFGFGSTVFLSLLSGEF